MRESVTRCEAIVFQREQLRYTGRGKHGFERHYVKRQCRRRAKGHGLCRQHSLMPNILREAR